MARSPKSVRHLLQDKPTLKRLEREICAQQNLLADVRQCLPADLAPHCSAAQLRDGTLVLHSDSPVWATRLRYLAPQLRSVLIPEHPALREIKIRLFVEQTAAPKQLKPAQKSDVAAAIIHDSAAYTKHAPLREALIRLGRALKSS